MYWRNCLEGGGDMNEKLMCVIVDKETKDEYWTDDIGGFHNPPIGYNPNGVFCGECSNTTCKGCYAAERIAKL